MVDGAFQDEALAARAVARWAGPCTQCSLAMCHSGSCTARASPGARVRHSALRRRCESGVGIVRIGEQGPGWLGMFM